MRIRFARAVEPQTQFETSGVHVPLAVRAFGVQGPQHGSICVYLPIGPRPVRRAMHVRIAKLLHPGLQFPQDVDVLLAAAGQAADILGQYVHLRRGTRFVHGRPLKMGNTSGYACPA